MTAPATTTTAGEGVRREQQCCRNHVCHEFHCIPLAKSSSLLRWKLVDLDAKKRALGAKELAHVRCGCSLYYVRQDRARGSFERWFECRRCGQKHAAWS